MRKQIFIVILIIILLLSSANLVYAAEGDIVSFSDSNLKQALINTGADTSGDGEITEGEMAGLSGSLDLSDKDISNIEGLQYAINIEALYLDNNNGIKSISYLSSLTNLKTLSLYFTDVSDLSVVINFPNLDYLNLERSDVIDITPVSSLANLQTLLINATDVESITPILGLTNLKELNIHGTRVRDISGLSGLTNLQILDIGYNYLNQDDFSALEPLTNMEHLFIAHNSFSDITPLQNMHSLMELNADYCDFTSIDVLSNMYDLEVLKLKYCNITDISVLADKIGLLELDISNNFLNPNDTTGDMAIIQDLSAHAIVNYSSQQNAIITYDGGLYGIPERSKDYIYHGENIILPDLSFDGSFIVDGWDIDNDGIADEPAGQSFVANLPFNVNHYKATYDAIYERDYTWPQGSGTEQDPYIISIPDQVNEIRYFQDSSFLLANDIDMTAAISEGGVFYYDGEGWNPINEFSGTLDGNGYEIRSLTSNRVETSFIKTLSETAEIKNLTLSQIHMEGEDGADGICYENNGTITNCTVSGYIAQTTGDIGATSFCAGIAGINYGAVSNCKVKGNVVTLDDGNTLAGLVAVNCGIIENSSNEADVTGVRTAGGLVGVNYATISACYNTGTVSSGGSSDKGGIAAKNYSEGLIKNCYNTGTIPQGGTAGGIVGDSAGTIQNCYNIGTVRTALVAETHGATIINCITIESTHEIIPSPHSSDTVINVSQKSSEEMSQQSSFLGYDFDSVWTMDGDEDYPYPELRNNGYTPPMQNTTDFAGGNGLPYDPYRVSTADHLNNVRYFAADWFEMQNDIDMTAATREGGDYYNDGVGWIPIGDNTYFYGVFDGGYHKIIGLKSVEQRYVGLFWECIETSIIRNLGVARAEIIANSLGTGTSYAGIIAIENHGYVTGCYTSGQVYGWYAGGIAKENTGLISDCYTTASVSGAYIGGFVNACSGTIERSYNAGSVKSGYDFARSAFLGEGCYHRDNGRAASGSTASDPGIELTEEGFTKKTSFGFFDFDNVWTMAGDAEYPYPELIGLEHIDMPDNTIEFGGGNGLPYAPYLILNTAHLNNMSYYASRSFKLLADIELSGANWEPFNFSGNFEGNNHVISNGNIIVDDWDEGFFKSTSYSTVSNLGIEDFSIVSKYNTPIGTSYHNVGLFAGKLYYSRITNCYATGTINCVRGENMGGFAGWSNSKINDCYVEANLIGEDEVGGFIGYLIDHTTDDIPDKFSVVKNCYFIGEVDAKHSVGGFAGYAIGTVSISDCYSDSHISGIKDVGGFTGFALYDGTVTNCYSLGSSGGNENVGTFIGTSDQDFSYNNCYYYSNTGTMPIGVGSNAVITKINIPEIDDVDINIPVASTELTTNFSLYGAPVGIEYLSTKSPEIAIIGNQQLKGVSLGNTEVNLLLTFLDARTAKVNGYETSITGIPPVTVPVTGISFAETEVYLHRYDTYTLIPIVLPEDATNKNLTWESNNEAVASVTEFGIVTANQPGYATITVTTQDGGFSAACEVSVDTPTSVQITSGNSYCWPGDTCLNVAKVLPETTANKTVIWTSNDESIAVIGETTGIATAISPGTAIFTATTQEGGYTDTCFMLVKQPVTQVEVIPDSTTLNVGESYNSLEVNVLPEHAYNKNVSYVSDNTNVATVDANGYISGISPGTANITVTAEDGGYSDTCTVTVAQPVISVELREKCLNMTVGDNTTIIAAISPANATNKNVTWSSSNEGVALVDGNGNVSAISGGTAIITVTTEDRDYTDICTVTVRSDEIESAIYAISSDGSINGIKINTTIAQLAANLNNHSADIKIFDQNGNEVTVGILCTGMTVKLIIDGKVRDELTIIILGDANGDGNISITDYTMARLDILGLKTLGHTAAAAADITGDGVVSITDYTLMRLDILGLKNIH